MAFLGSRLWPLKASLGHGGRGSCGIGIQPGWCTVGVFLKWGYPIAGAAGWFTMENPIVRNG